jgi:transposase InsO family protein
VWNRSNAWSETCIGSTQGFRCQSGTTTGEKVRFIRTDNGTEFVKGEAEQWYCKKGIIHQFTTPYTPEVDHST